MAEALVYSLQGACPAKMSPTVTTGAVTSTPRAMLGTNGIPVASSRAYVMGASTKPVSTEEEIQLCATGQWQHCPMHLR